MSGPEGSNALLLELQVMENLDSTQPPQIATEGVMGHEQFPVTQLDGRG